MYIEFISYECVPTSIAMHKHGSQNAQAATNDGAIGTVWPVIAGTVDARTIIASGLVVRAHSKKVAAAARFPIRQLGLVVSADLRTIRG